MPYNRYCSIIGAMDRRKIEQTTASLAVFLLFFITIGIILFAADQIFNWDIFAPDIEKVLGFVLLASVVIIISSVLVNVMLNLSIIAINSDLFIEEHTSNEKRSKKA